MMIKQYRQALCMTQLEMSVALGVNLMTYAKWERGERSITAGPRSAIEMLLYMHDKGVLSGWIELRSRGANNGN